jgi:hypothetical protein
MKRLRKRRMTMMRREIWIAVRIRRSVVIVVAKSTVVAGNTKRISVRRRDAGISIEGSRRRSPQIRNH